MKKTIRLTENDLIKLVKRVINEQFMIKESIRSNDGKYELKSQGGFLVDNLGNTFCVKVNSFLTGDFPQGINKVWKNNDGSAGVLPTGSKIGTIELTPNEVNDALTKLKSGKEFIKKQSGATITIGKNLVGWCKKEWSK